MSETMICMSNTDVAKSKKKEIDLNFLSMGQLAVPVEEKIPYSQNDELKLRVIVNQLGERKTARFKAVREEFLREMKKINIEKMKELKTISSNLVSFLKDIKRRFQTLKSLDDEMASMKSEWDEAISSWRFEVNTVMKAQTFDCKTILANLKNNLMRTHQFPKPLVDKQICHYVKDINNVIIANERMYTETETHLRLIFENLAHDWLVNFSFHEIKPEWLTPSEVELEKLGDLSNKVIETDREQNTIQVLIDCLFELCKEEMPNFDLTTSLAMYLSHLDFSKVQICILNNETLCTVKSHLEKTIETVQGDAYDDFHTLWYDIVALIGEKIVDGHKFLKSSTEIWNRFLNKLQLIEHHFTRNIDIHRMGLHKQFQMAGETMNIVVDKLRQAKSLESLNLTHDGVNNFLKTYENMCLEEKETLESLIGDFPNACFLLFDIYSAEMAVLRGETLPRGQQTIPDMKCSSSTSVEEEEYISSPLNDIKFCMISIQNWLDGYKELMEILEKEIIYFLGSFIENWIDLKRGESELWYSLELENTNQRRQRIKNDIYDIRANELRTHENIINRHRKGIHKMFASMKHLPHSLYERTHAIDVGIEKDRMELEEHLKKDPLQANLYKRQIDQIIDHGNTLKVHWKKKYLKEVERVSYWIKHSTLSLFKSIKLFGEGGNFSHEEAETVVRNLNRELHLVNTVKNDVSNRLDASNGQTLKAKMTSISITEFILKTEELALTQACDNMVNQLKKALKIEISNAKKIISKIQGLTSKAEDNATATFWKNAMMEINYYCKYFELPTSSTHLEHESKSVYRGVYDSNKEITPIEEQDNSKPPKVSAVKGRSKKKRKRKRAPATEPRSRKDSTLKAQSPKKFRKSRRAKTRKRSSKSVKRDKTDKPTVQGDKNVKSVKKESTSEDELRFGSYPMDIRVRSSDNCVQAVYPYPQLFYYTIFVKSMKKDNFLCNTKMLMINCFNDCKSKILHLTTKMKNNKKFILLCGDLIHRYIIKIRKYNLQIEHVWFELIYSFLLSLIGFQTSLNALPATLFEKFFTDLGSRKDQLMGMFKREMREAEAWSKIGQEKLDGELKPYLGYPLNVNHLENLILRVIKLCTLENVRIRTAMKNYKRILKKTNKRLNLVIGQFHTEVEDIHRYLVKNEAVTSFVVRTYTYMLHLCKNKITKTDEDYYFQPSNRRGQILDYLEPCKDSFDVMTGNLDVHKFIVVIIRFILHITGGRKYSVKNANRPVLIKLPYACRALKTQVEDYKKKMKNFEKEEMEIFKSECSQTCARLKEWKIRWCHDIKCIKNLYSIKESFAPLYKKRKG